MSEWKEYRLGDIADCALGKMLDQKKNQGTPRPYLNNVSLRWGSFNIDNSQTMLFEDSELERYQIKKNDIIMCEGGEPGRCAVWTNESPICYQKALHRIRVKEGFDNWFLYYYLRHFVLSGRAQVFFTGTTIKHFPLQALKSIVIKAPAFQVQQKIASILSSLDSKIENNRKISANLEAQAQALFKHWFIDFAPFKDGKFVESELGMIPEGWRVGSILDIAELYDYQRKPLSSMEREDMKGDYPYYGATSIMDYIDKYIFDGTYVLMGEDGSVVKDNGCPYLQYVWGKFWPNNHAHVMQGKNGFSTEMLYCFLSITDVRSIVTGAVQMKISQRSMSHLLTVIPPKSVCGDYNRIIRPLFDLIKSTKEENVRLSTLRDTLLPKLMSGAIKV